MMMDEKVLDRIAGSADGQHDQSLCEIPLPSTPLLVFFIDDIWSLVLGQPCLEQRAITMETQDLSWFGP